MTRGNVLWASLAVALLCACWWLWSDRVRAESRRERAEVELADAQELARVRGERVQRIESELLAVIAQRDSLAREAQRVVEQSKEREQASTRKRGGSRSLPEGVRLALLSYNELLGKSGNPQLRFLHAKAITPDKSLLGAELIDSDPKSLKTTLYMPDSLSTRLERDKGRLTMLMHGGARVANDLREELPASGYAIVIEGVEGKLWEQFLPMLVEGEGIYLEEAAPASRPSRLPTATAEAWCDRINEFLARVPGQEQWRCERLRGLEGGVFREVLLVFTKGGRTVKQSAEAESFAIRVDTKAGTVSLWLANGVLHGSDGDTSIPETGYAILLPGLEPKAARDALLGLVVGD